MEVFSDLTVEFLFCVAVNLKIYEIRCIDWGNTVVGVMTSLRRY